MSPTKNQDKTVAFILSLGHSGSTLLGYFLGVHRSVLHLGEIPSPLKRKRPFKCRYCIEEPCPVWNGILKMDFVKRSYETQLLARNCRTSRIRRMANMAVARIRGRYVPPGAVYQRVFSALPDVHIIVDGSKNVPWANWNSRCKGFRSVYLLLIRDLRAVVNSYRRTHGNEIAETTRKIVSKLNRIQAFLDKQDATSVLSIRYEEFVNRPDEVGRHICTLLNIDFDDTMLEYYRYPNHVIGGNPGPMLQGLTARGKSGSELDPIMSEAYRDYYSKHPPGFRLDERWQQELSAGDLREFAAVGAEMNQRYGYLD